MSRPLRWGILGAGIIAHKLADAVRQVPGCELAAVASKTPEKARVFAAQFGIRAARDYEDLVTDPEVDVVYVATTHNFHHENARLALEHDKHVLIEKPITVNAVQAQDLADLSRARGRFAMEAMWTRFLPTWQALRARVAEGAIGELRHLDVTFGGIVPPHYEARLTDPALAGGVTLDMGVYPISFVRFVSGEPFGEGPQDVASMARFSETGVDEVACYLLRHRGGCLSTISTSYRLRMPEWATLHGTTGFIEYPTFHRGDRFTIQHHGGTGAVGHTEEAHHPHEENGFVYQVREVAARIAAGAIESEIMPMSESVAILRLIDRMRATWGLRYPFE